jgi:hypothetical protein
MQTTDMQTTDRQTGDRQTQTDNRQSDRQADKQTSRWLKELPTKHLNCEFLPVSTARTIQHYDS